MDPDGYIPSGTLPYPDSEFGYGLKQIAMLIKAEVVLEVAAIDLGGWDTHFGQGSVEGLMKDLGQGLGAFHADLVDQMNRVTVVGMSEFSRRVRENASLGTDHGHGCLMMLLSGYLDQPRVHTHWPGLDPDFLFGPGDLRVTIDYRDVLGEICTNRLNNPALETIFPNFVFTTQGLFR